MSESYLASDNMGESQREIMGLRKSATSPMSPTLFSALEKLGSYRTNNTRASQEIFESGSIILKSGSSTNLGEEGA
jgi:hypothetical protein